MAWWWTLAAVPARAILPGDGSEDPVARKVFFAPELYLADLDARLDEVSGLANQPAWDEFLRDPAADSTVYLDLRSARPTGLITQIPLIPGDGLGNRLSLDDLSTKLGWSVRTVDEAVMAQLLTVFAEEYEAVLGFDTRSFGEVRVSPVTGELWQISIGQQIDGVPVRDALLVATVSHGNLVLLGAEGWGDVELATAPRISSEEALLLGFDFAGVSPQDYPLIQPPRLEIVAVAPREELDGGPDAVALGEGYDYRLIWSFGFTSARGLGEWEILVNAESGEILELADRLHSLEGEIRGGVYPLSNTEICPSGERCGTLEEGVPMPFADTGLAAPNDFTDSGGGGFERTGTLDTELQGRFVRIADQCGTTGGRVTRSNLDLGGVNGDHDCDAPSGGRAGNTAASRSAFYEINRTIEMARGWLPNLPFLNAPIKTLVNIGSTCNAFFSPVAGTLNFYRSGGGCGNTGEIAAVFDHEWGHALDFNDANGRGSNTSEAYADIAAAYRLETSCIGYGFFEGQDLGCGATSDSTGFNANTAILGGARCAKDCSGVREIDFANLTNTAGTQPPVPDTPTGFVCDRCSSGRGPCGRQIHCASAPVTQAAWDLVTRDLTAPPFSFDSNTAFLTGAKLFFQGSGNVRKWYSCSCLRKKSAGCGASTGYMQWLAADDDNGSLADGTPHMTALFAAFDRHDIACSDPVPRSAGCGSGPSAAPVASAFSGDSQVAVQWTAVPRASSYRVYRADGATGGDGCGIGKVLVGETAATAFTDIHVANDRQACYTVLPVGASEDCFGRASACSCATPEAKPLSLSCTPRPLTVPRGGRGEAICSVGSQNGFSGSAQLTCFPAPGTTCAFSPGTVTVPAGGDVTANLVVTVPANGVLAGDYFATAFATAAGTSTPLPMPIRVPQLGLACSPAALTVPAGDSAAASCLLTRAPSVPGPLELRCDGEQPGLGCVFTPSTVTPPANSAVQVSLVVEAGATVNPGIHSLTAVARSVPQGSESAAPFTVTVPTAQSDFQVACSALPFGGNLFAGQTINVACSVDSLNAFSGPVALTCGHLAVFGCTLTPTQVTPPAGGSATFNLRLTVGNAVQPGEYSVNLKGQSGPTIRNHIVGFEVEELVP